MSTIDQQFVEYIVKSLVSKPDDVKIDRRIDEKGVLLELTVAAEDLGRVIGKRGATAQSLRTLLRALGTKNEARYNLKIIDTGEGGQPIGRPTRQAEDQDVNTNDSGQDQDSNDDTTTSDTTKDSTDEPPEQESDQSEEPESDVVSKTRKELADLDDLDV